MSKKEWEENTIVYRELAEGDTQGHVALEGSRWGWALLAYAEGRNEPACLDEGQEATNADAKLACDCAWVRYQNNTRAKPQQTQEGQTEITLMSMQAGIMREVTAQRNKAEARVAELEKQLRQANGLERLVDFLETPEAEMLLDEPLTQARLAVSPRENCPDCKGRGYFEDSVYDGSGQVCGLEQSHCALCRGTGKVSPREAKAGELEAENERLKAALGERGFPVLQPEGYDCPRYVRWGCLNEETAMRNHGGQNLEKLASRGGLGIEEIYNVRHNITNAFKQREVSKEDALAEVISIRWPNQAALQNANKTEGVEG